MAMMENSNDRVNYKLDKKRKVISFFENLINSLDTTRDFFNFDNNSGDCVYIYFKDNEVKYYIKLIDRSSLTVGNNLELTTCYFQFIDILDEIVYESIIIPSDLDCELKGILDKNIFDY